MLELGGGIFSLSAIRSVKFSLPASSNIVFLALYSLFKPLVGEYSPAPIFPPSVDGAPI
jgi:hypothetical protein